MVEKWPSGLEDCLTRVPLMMRMPGNKAGHVVKEQVELFDLMATVLDIADIEAEHTHFARSLVPQLNGAAGDPERIVFAEGGYDTHEPHCFEGYEPRMRKNPKNAGKYRPKYFVQQNHPLSVTRAVMARTPEYKLIYRPQSVSELFDLKKDPRELRNVIDDPAYGAIRADLQQKILDWLIHTSDVTPVHEDRRGLPPPSEPRVVSRDEAFDASGRIPGVGAARDQKASS
jgi:choline-sulfatase